MARNRKLKKLKSPCYAMIVFEDGFKDKAMDNFRALLKKNNININLSEPNGKAKIIPAEDDQKENVCWVNFA